MWTFNRSDLTSSDFCFGAQVNTGCELADDFGTLRVLDAAEWQRRRERLQKLGGPPVLE